MKTAGSPMRRKAKKASIAFLNKVRKTCNDSAYESFLHIMDQCKSQDIKDYNEVCESVAALFKDKPYLYVEFTEFLPDCFMQNDAQTKEETSTEKAAVCRREKGCFRVSGDNPHEQILFKCEDHQYEMDMLISGLKSAVEHAEKLLKFYDTGEALETYFTARDIRTIRALYYEDFDDDVIKQLQRTPVVAVTSILPRLKEKYKETAESRERALALWAAAYKENHLKAVDHVSFYQPSGKSGAGTKASGKQSKQKSRAIGVEFHNFGTGGALTN